MKFKGFIEDLGDKTISHTKDGVICTEIITVTCARCKRQTDTVVTCKDRTFYGHFDKYRNITDWCIVLRHGGELKYYDLPDFLLYVQREQGSHENLNISSVAAHW